MKPTLSLRSKFYLVMAPLAVASILLAASAARTTAALQGTTDEVERSAELVTVAGQVARLVTRQAVDLQTMQATGDASLAEDLSEAHEEMRPALVRWWVLAQGSDAAQTIQRIEAEYGAFAEEARAFVAALEEGVEPVPPAPRTDGLLDLVDGASSGLQAELSATLKALEAGSGTLLLPVVDQRLARLQTDAAIVLAGSAVARGLLAQVESCLRFALSNAVEERDYAAEEAGETTEAIERWERLVDGSGTTTGPEGRTVAAVAQWQRTMEEHQKTVIGHVEDGDGPQALAAVRDRMWPTVVGTYLPRSEMAIAARSADLPPDARGFQQAVTLAGGLYGAAGVVVAVGALVGPLYFSRRVVDPIIELERATASVAAGRRGVRLDVGSRDEVGRLAASFNAMVGDVQRAEEQLRGANELLLQADRAKSLFVNTAAHELNTPLTPLKIQLSLLRKGRHGPLTPAQERSLGLLSRNVDRLAALVGDLLEAARIQNGKVGLEPRELDLADLLREALDSFRDQADHVGVRCVLQVPAAMPVHADPKRLNQVLFNLLSNAIKYTRPGGRVHVAAHWHDEGVAIEVRDDGVGLTRQQISMLFQPFTNVHEHTPTARPGNGLGLFISKGIVEAHGGRIWCDSAGPGAGATFMVSLPHRPAQPAASG